MSDKPLGRKAYGSIGCLPGGRYERDDKGLNPGHVRILTEKARDRHDVIIVQEKLDGTNVAVARLEGEIVPLIRAGYRAVSSAQEQHQLFNVWAWHNRERFLSVLCEGERICGEWLALAHGIRYQLDRRHLPMVPHDWDGPDGHLLEPFVAFDIMTEDRRLPYMQFTKRVVGVFTIPPLVHLGGPIGVGAALQKLGLYGRYGALDGAEGLVYRCERQGEVDFLGKYVRPEFVPGRYFSNISGQPEVWNWRPTNDAWRTDEREAAIA